MNLSSRSTSLLESIGSQPRRGHTHTSHPQSSGMPLSPLRHGLLCLIDVASHPGQEHLAAQLQGWDRVGKEPRWDSVWGQTSTSGLTGMRRVSSGRKEEATGNVRWQRLRQESGALDPAVLLTHCGLLISCGGQAQLLEA